MQVLVSEPAIIDSSCEIRIGESSWDDNRISVKYAVRGENGQVTRGGEVPIEALSQMFAFALGTNILKSNGEVSAVAVENYARLRAVRAGNPRLRAKAE